MKLSSTSWTTEKVDSITEQINTTGKVPKDTPFYLGDMNLRSPNIQYGYTADELAEMAKCKNVIYFGENMANVMTDDGIRTVKLRPYQKVCLVQFAKYRKNILLSSRQSGKCVGMFTRIDVMDLNGDKFTVPIYELYFDNLYHKTMLDRIIYSLCKLINSI